MVPSDPAIAVDSKDNFWFSFLGVHFMGQNVDFTSLNKRSAIIAPGAKTTLKIVFKKKGAIQVVCDVPRHIQLGMVSSFKVK